MAAITVEDLDNAKLDVDHIAEIATSPEQTATDRMGHTKLTIAGAIQTMTSFNYRGDWATGTAYAIKDVFTDGAVTYVAVRAHTSTNIAADLAAGNIALYQGVTVQTVDILTSGVDFDPGDTTLTLSRSPGPSENNLTIHMDAAFLGPDQYTLSGTTVTLAFPIPADITHIYATIGVTQSMLVPPPGSVGDLELKWDIGLRKNFVSVASMRANFNKFRHSLASTSGYWAPFDNGHANYVYDASDVSSVDNGCTVIVTADGARLKMETDGPLRAEACGIRGRNDSADAATNTTQLLAAIASMRRDARTIDKGDAAHTPVTCYASGHIMFGHGIFPLLADQLNFTQDHGLMISGQGSRGASGSNHGNTVLLYKGSTGSYFLNVEGNGARGFQMRNLDLCYENSGFVGGLVNMLTTVGFKFEDVHFGSMVFTEAETVTSAQWLMRLNEYEVAAFDKCTFNGAAIGVYFDDTVGGSGWLGNGALFTNCWFYDFTDSHVRADGAKVALSVTFENTGFNPINVSPTRCMNVQNMDGLALKNCTFQSSDGSAPSVEWCRVLNSQSSIDTCTIGEFIKAGTFSGHINFTSNNTQSPSGWTFLQGSITTRSNRFDQCENAITLASQVDSLVVDCANDRFGATVGRSYYCPDTSSLISGQIIYAKDRDFSSSKFSNVNRKLRIVGFGDEVVTGARNLTNADTGKTFMMGAGAAIVLPQTPQPGVEFHFIKTAVGSARVDSFSANQFYTGDGGAKTSLVAGNSGNDVGSNFSVKAFDNTAWATSARGPGWVAS